jgi:hypothetical protein
MASQNLSYKVLKPTLNHLVSCKLVEYEIDGKSKLVRTTEQGLIALEAYEIALALLEGNRHFSSSISNLGRLEPDDKDHGTVS